MSAPSDGARADARKRLAESRPTADVALAMFRRKYGREPVPESFDQSRLADCRETVALIWPEIAGVIADAKAEALREAADLYRSLGDSLPICAGHVVAELDIRADDWARR